MGISVRVKANLKTTPAEPVQGAGAGATLLRGDKWATGGELW